MEDASQICFMEIDGTIVFFNEAEAVSDLDAEEPETLEPKPARKPKSVGKKDADLSGLPVNIITHYMTEEELVAEFGKMAGSSFRMRFPNATVSFLPRLK